MSLFALIEGEDRIFFLTISSGKITVTLSGRTWSVASVFFFKSWKQWT